MTGDGTNDAPALAQADVGVAMNTGTSAAKEAGNMVDLDSDPTKLIEIVEIGKQLLITRGALTTFSIANDITPIRGDAPARSAVPADAVTASASGLDPHISPAYAALQTPRIARERDMSEDAVRTLVEENTTGRAVGFLGEPAVNVLMLNVALDAR